MMRHLFFGGVHPAGRKELSAGGAPIPAPIPAQVVIPMSQHIGALCVPLVKPGDQVKMGQKIGDGEGLCAPVHASVSGTVLAVEPRRHPNGSRVLSVVIENDFQDTPDRTLTPHLDGKGLTSDEIVAIIREAGTPATGNGRPSAALANAIEALEKQLSFVGWVEAGEVYRLCAERDISVSTIRRARVALGLKVLRVGMQPNQKNYWYRPELTESTVCAEVKNLNQQLKLSG